MATVNFSVPQDVKDRFDRTFKGKNKSAILTDLMRRAIEEADLTARRMRAFNELNARAHLRKPMTDDQIRAVRDEGRK